MLASTALAARVAARVAQAPDLRPHIERAGLGYKKLNASGQVLPATVKVVDVRTRGRVAFRFPRYERIIDDWRNNVSDHCPIKIWF